MVRWPDAKFEVTREEKRTIAKPSDHLSLPSGYLSRRDFYRILLLNKLHQQLDLPDLVLKNVWRFLQPGRLSMRDSMHFSADSAETVVASGGRRSETAN